MIRIALVFISFFIAFFIFFISIEGMHGRIFALGRREDQVRLLLIRLFLIFPAFMMISFFTKRIVRRN